MYERARVCASKCVCVCVYVSVYMYLRLYVCASYI